VTERQYQAVLAVIDAVGYQFDEHVTASARTTRSPAPPRMRKRLPVLMSVFIIRRVSRCVRESRAIRVKCVAAVPSHGAGVRS